MEISIGDYVLTGGELVATVITDSIVRLIPGVISDETSNLFQILFKIIYYLTLFTPDLMNTKDGKFLKYYYQATKS